MHNEIDQPPIILKEVPSSKASFILGIVSICISTLCCCFDGSFLGVVLGIIGFILGRKAMKSYELEPDQFTEKSYKRAKTGMRLSIVGFIVALIVSALYLGFWYLAITRQLPPELQEQVNQSLEIYGI